MDDLEEFESRHKDLMAWQRFQDELERIKGENTYDDLHDFEDKSLCNLVQNAATIRWSNSGRLRYLQKDKSKIFSFLNQ